jgi:hypothetical protein
MAEWRLVSSDHRCGVSLEAGDDGPLTGALTLDGQTYNVAGGWDASFSVPGRNFSAFAVFGKTGNPIPDFVAATGIMTGGGTAPTDIGIMLDVSSCSDGTIQHYEGILIPA